MTDFKVTLFATAPDNSQAKKLLREFLDDYTVLANGGLRFDFISAKIEPISREPEAKPAEHERTPPAQSRLTHMTQEERNRHFGEKREVRQKRQEPDPNFLKVRPDFDYSRKVAPPKTLSTATLSPARQEMIRIEEIWSSPTRVHMAERRRQVLRAFEGRGWVTGGQIASGQLMGTTLISPTKVRAVARGLARAGKLELRDAVGASNYGRNGATSIGKRHMHEMRLPE